VAAGDNGYQQVETKGLEPSTPGLQSHGTRNASTGNKGLMETVSAVCTRVCTGEPKTGHFEMLQSLAVALRASLPAEDCHRLAMLLEAPDDLPTDRPG